MTEPRNAPKFAVGSLPKQVTLANWVISDVMPEMELMKLLPCKVPWSLRPALGYTLNHSVTNSENACSLFMLATREKTARATLQTLVAIVFDDCMDLRLTNDPCWDCKPTHFEFTFFPKDFNACPDDYLKWYESTWQTSDNCPDPGFYFVTDSSWSLESNSEHRRTNTHFVVMTENGYLEFLSRQAHWIEYNSTAVTSMMSPRTEQIISRGNIDGITKR